MYQTFILQLPLCIVGGDHYSSAPIDIVYPPMKSDDIKKKKDDNFDGTEMTQL